MKWENSIYFWFLYVKMRKLYIYFSLITFLNFILLLFYWWYSERPEKQVIFVNKPLCLLYQMKNFKLYRKGERIIFHCRTHGPHRIALSNWAWCEDDTSRWITMYFGQSIGWFFRLKKMKSKIIEFLKIYTKFGLV